LRQAELVRYLVLAAQREGSRRLTRDLRAIGLTPSQSEVVRILGDHGPLTLTGLGELLVCESGKNPSRLVDRLVGAGLVERVASARDRRQVRLSLTGTGRELEAEVRAVEEQLYSDVDAALVGVDLRPVVRLLRRLSAGEPAGVALERRIAAQTAGNTQGGHELSTGVVHIGDK
jgi:MarR family transcriptional regulator, organic hydroperoxide resistance regulator